MKANHNSTDCSSAQTSTVSNGSKIAIKTGNLTLIGFLEEKHEINRRKVNIFILSLGTAFSFAGVRRNHPELKESEADSIAIHQQNYRQLIARRAITPTNYL